MLLTDIQLDDDAQKIYSALEMTEEVAHKDREEEKIYQLDAAARSIYEQFRGLEKREALFSYADEQERLNDWRRCMVEFVFFLAHTLNNYRLSDKTIKNKDDIRPLMERLNKLAEIPAPDGEKKVVIRQRGADVAPGSRNGENLTDYVVSVGECVVDRPVIEYLVRAKILDQPDLLEKLDKAFKFFNLARIFTIEIRLNRWEKKDKRLIAASLLLWARYFTDLRIAQSRIIYNEAGLPDANLTILAGLNKFNYEMLQAKVKDVHEMISQDGFKKKFPKVRSTYDALLVAGGFEKKPVRPLVEINNNAYIQMWRDCFDIRGRFDRSRFYRYRPEFLQWENAFYLLWLDLKSVAIKEDRTTILNCIVKFIKDSPFIKGYMDYILKDFFYYPLHLHFSDLNSMIFANMLLFKNFADRDYDFGRSPQEVLSSTEEKNLELIDHLSTKINNEWSDRFYEKIKTIQKNLMLALKSKTAKSETLSVNFLINLMREVFIFMAMVEGRIVNNVLRETVKVYGNPNSEAYQSKTGIDHMTQLLQFLQVSIRCLLMVRERQDLDILKIIRASERNFLSLTDRLQKGAALNRQVIKTIMSQVDAELAALKK